MKIDIETLRKTSGIGNKTLERIIKQHEVDNNIKSFKSVYIESDKYKLDKDINLWQGDCLELMNHIPDKSVDMILADLPYGTTACNWDEVIPFKPLWSHYKRIIKDNGAIVLFGSEPFSTKLRMSNLDWYKYDWIWKKNNSTGFQLANKRPLKDYEVISVFCENVGKYNPQGLKEYGKENKRGSMGQNWGKMKHNNYIQKYTNYPRQIIKCPSDTVKIHSTQKPTQLLEYLIKTYTDENMLVLDNTMGSGSTGVACKNTNRRFIGMEREEEYFKISEKRLDLYNY